METDHACSPFWQSVSQPPSIAINVEAALMEALAEAEEDEYLDDRAVEICSDRGIQ